MSTGSPGTRWTRVWADEGTASAAPVLGALATAYGGLVGARGWLYARGVLRSRRLPCPVVSIGNLTVGGTGKTPAVELAVQTLLGLGHRPAVVSRGYGRRSRGVQIVADSAAIRLDPEEAGDEPFLLARRLPGVPVVVGASRWEAARRAVDRFAVTAVVLDDGFQHRTLAKDLEIVMARARRPWGNGRLFPRGPLREPLEALGRADLVVVTGAEDDVALAEVRAAVGVRAPSVPLLAARYVPVECWDAEGLRPRPLTHIAGIPLLAFAGIAAPEAFLETLAGLGADVRGTVAFGDHHWYRADDLDRLAERAAAAGATALVTTEKDWVRLKRLPLPRPLFVVSVRLELVTGPDEWRKAFEQRCPTP